MRLPRITFALAALWTIGCASAPEAQREADGLVRIYSAKPGNLFVHPSRSIDDYDDVWLAEIGIQYAEGQEPLAEPDERRVRTMVADTVLEESSLARLAARQPGPCTLQLGVHLAALSFPRPGVTGSRNRGSAVVVSEFRDSQTGEPVVRYGQRRELASASRRGPEKPDLDQLGATVRGVLRDLDVAMGKSLAADSAPPRATGARASQGCNGVIGQTRREASAGR
jgi:hypothetical protein